MKVTNNDMQKSKIYWMLVNGAIGDQYGAPIEMMDRETIAQRYTTQDLNTYLVTEKIEDRPFTYTDDTQLTIGTLKAILEHGVKVDKYDFLHAYLQTFEPSRGYSLNMYRDFSHYIGEGLGVIPNEDETMKMRNLVDNVVEVKQSRYNGGLLRVAPLLIVLSTLAKEGVEITNDIICRYVEAVHYPSHMDQECIDVSTYYVSLLWKIYTRQPRTFKSLEMLITHSIQNMDPKSNIYFSIWNVLEYFVHGKFSNEVMSSNDKQKFEQTLSNVIDLDGVLSYETLGTALLGVMWSFYEPEKTLLNTLQFGGDTDTICAIAGQISGLLFGEKVVNPNLLENLEKTCFVYFDQVD